MKTTMIPFRIELPLKISYPTVNAYVFRDPVPTLVDCGMNTPGTIAAMEKGLRKLKLKPTDIRKVVITHPHVDHIGLAGWFAENGAEIWLSDLADSWLNQFETARSHSVHLLLATMADHGFDKKYISMTRGFYTGLAPRFTHIPAESRRVFRPGDHIEIGGQQYRVIHAPGHSHRQVCFFQPESGQLFSADMLLPKTPVPLVEPAPDDPTRREPGLPALLESYRRFKNLPVRDVYPGHDQPFSEHVRLIDAQLGRIDVRKAECLALIRQGVGSLPLLLSKMYRKLPPNARLGGLAMLIGYLDLLVEDGLVKPVRTDGVQKYITT